ncbi:hypothetical protein [Nocardiopsis synnemataformans]|uniref:hypothetical protein n=1 Tax=Nocardiopsis synnemataformans TaxID=61305 RepID=UPI003EB7927A
MKFDLVGTPEVPQDDAPRRETPSSTGSDQEATSGALTVRRTAERAGARAGADVAALTSTLGRLRERIEATGSPQDDAPARYGIRPPANFRTAAFSPVARPHDEYSG